MFTLFNKVTQPKTVLEYFHLETFFISEGNIVLLFFFDCNYLTAAVICYFADSDSAFNMR